MKKNLFNEVKPVHVAVGVVHNQHGQILFAQRPIGKPYAGWWEFPGGKLEKNETIALALARELREELGIQILDCALWLHQDYEYSHAKVKLHTCNVFSFTGEVTALENQAFQWGYADKPPQPFLPAALPVLKALQLPSILYKTKTNIKIKTNNSFSNLVTPPALIATHWQHQSLLTAYKDQFVRQNDTFWLSAEVNTIDDISIAHQLGCDFVVMVALENWGDLSEQLLNVSVPVFIDISHLNLELNFALSLARASGALGIVVKNTT
jgi:8-oxo-dGTP diphosphatase